MGRADREPGAPLQDTPEHGALAMLALRPLTLWPHRHPLHRARALLTLEERDWLNSYHATVRERLAPHLSWCGLGLAANTHRRAAALGNSRTKLSQASIHALP